MTEKSNNITSARVSAALERSLDVFGNEFKDTILDYLWHRGIRLQEGESGPTIDQIEAALRELIGKGTSLILEMINHELEDTRPVKRPPR